MKNWIPDSILLFTDNLQETVWHNICTACQTKDCISFQFCNPLLSDKLQSKACHKPITKVCHSIALLRISSLHQDFIRSMEFDAKEFNAPMINSIERALVAEALDTQI